MMMIALVYILMFLPIVDTFSVSPSSTKELLRLKVATKDREQSDLFTEELTWAQKNELKVTPDDKWIIKEFNSADSSLANQHHEWFSDAIAPATVKPAPPLRNEEQMQPDLHEWFAEEIEWLKNDAKLTPPLDKAIPFTDKKAIFNDHQRELFSFQMANSDHTPPPVPSAPPISKENIVGSEWFSNGMKTMNNQAVAPPVTALDRSLRMYPSEWFSQVKVLPIHPTAIAKLPIGRIANAEWFYEAIMDGTEETKPE